MDKERAAKIAAWNDAFRKTGFGVMITRGIQYLPDVCGLMEAVKRFNKFDADNDPYGEHDFGTLEWHGKKVFWKIDYYHQTRDFWEDPLSPNCRRVMTVMLGEDY
jgi:hypothetical protein